MRQLTRGGAARDAQILDNAAFVEDLKKTKVWVVDEGGLVAASTFDVLMTVANELGIRVIVFGDVNQVRAAATCGALRCASDARGAE